MAELEKKVIDVQGQVSPEGQAGVPSKAETVESKPVAHETAHPASERVVDTVVASMPVAPVQAVGPLTPVKDELTQEIEEVLSEDLEDLYKQLPPERQQKFKQEGEKTAGLIRQMIWHGKFHGRRILHLIVRWLKLIPGVNKFFLEQESKIKTDKLQMLAEEHKKDSTRR